MTAEKLSISLDAELASTVRADAREHGVTVSTWLADAAQARVRQRRLGEALDAMASEFGELSDEEAQRLVRAAHRRSVIVSGDEDVE